MRDATDVRFRYRPGHGSATQQKKVLALSHEEFLRRFLLHLLPPGFKRIRHYGLMANPSKAVKLAACSAALKIPAPVEPPAESAVAFYRRVTRRDPLRCRCCPQGRLVTVRSLPRPSRLPALRATGPPNPS